KGGRAVIGATGDAAETLHGLARRKKMGVRRLGHDFDVQPGVGLSVDDARYAPRLGLRGEHQWQNAATAVAALHSLRDAGFDIPNHAIETGLRLARWAGRLERRRVRGVEWIFDGAHNPSAAEALGKHLAQLSPKRTVLLFGALGDKDHEGLLRPLDSHADERVYALPKVPRAADLRALARRFPGRVARSVRDGLRLAEAKAGAGGRVVVSGSLFLVADARAKLLGLRADPI
ncbi:MAG: cyanophycin synthetase, partial [Myxococcota bacterium]